MKIKISRLLWRFAAILIIITLSGCSSAAKAYKINTETIQKAEELIQKAFEDDNLYVKNAAISMMKYLDKNGTFSKVAAIFGDFSYANTYLGKNYFKYNALETLYTLGPEKTMEYLLSNNDFILESFDLYRLFSIIGFDKITRFDNLFYYQGLNYEFETPNNHSLYTNMLYAYFYLETEEDRYKNAITYRLPGGMGPHAMAELYDFYKNNNLPINRLIFTTQNLGGVLAPKGLEANYGLSASYNLKELLFQALLYRWGISDSVYKTEFATENADFQPAIVSMDHYEIKNLPYLHTIGALARFYAGVPKEDDETIITTNFENFQPEVQYEIADTLLNAPETEAQKNLVYGFLVKQGLYIQRMIADTWKNKKSSPVPESLLTMLREGKDMLVKTAIIEGIANRGNKQYLEILEEFVDNPDPLIAVTASGAYIKLAREKGGE